MKGTICYSHKSKFLKIFHIKNFGVSYGVEVDKFGNIYIPEFSKGYIVKINSNFNNITLLKFKNNKLQKASILEIFFFNSKINRFFGIFKSNFLKPHDIYIYKTKMYITQMGLGYLLGGGKVDILNLKGELIKTIGLSLNDGKGMISPVMTCSDSKSNSYISEYGGNRILVFDKSGNIKYWIGNKNLNQNINNKEISKNNNLFNIKLKNPHSIKIGSDKNFYVVDSWNHRIIKFNKKGKFLGWIGKERSNKIKTNWNTSGKSKAGNELGAFNAPIDLVFYKKFMYITDCNNHRIVKINLNGKSVGWFGESEPPSNKIWKNENYKSKSSNSSFGFYNPYGMRIKDDTIYIADKNNFRIKIIRSKKLFDKNILK